MSGQTADLAALFGRVARSYDAERRVLLPALDAFYGAALAAAGPLAPGARVLDLGAGTGLFSGLLAARWPGLRLTLQDSTPAMLAEAEARFAAIPGASAELAIRDMREGPAPGRFDAVISALAIHHLEHPEQRRLFAEIAERLPPGGRFVNAEQIAEPLAEDEARAIAGWEAEARALGATDAMLEAAAARMAHDRSAPIGELLAWLEAAGFQSRLTWRRGRFAVLTAERIG